MGVSYFSFSFSFSFSCLVDLKIEKMEGKNRWNVVKDENLNIMLCGLSFSFVFQ